MRRMTISRSSLATLVALAAGAVTSAVAQIPIQRPIQQAQERAAPASAPGQASDMVPGRRSVELGTPGTISTQNPGTHVVMPGETLWALAQQYLGDPMLWPEIYRLNTTTIEDPHWIYPGEELRLSALEPPRDTMIAVQPQNFTVTPTEDTIRAAAPTSLSGPTVFSGGPARSRASTSIAVATNRAYRAVREGEFFSSGFLTEGQPLATGRLVRGGGDNDASKVPATAYLFETVTFTPIPGEAARAGELMLVFRRSEEIGTFGQIVMPTGVVRVKGPSGQGNNLMDATVVKLFDTMDGGQEVLRIAPFVNNSNVRAMPISGGVEARIVGMRDRRVVPQIQDVFFFDKGANDGLRIGDIVELYQVHHDAEHGGTSEEKQGLAIVVNTRNRTSTAVIVDLNSGNVGPQSQVRQVRRMPS